MCHINSLPDGKPLLAIAHPGHELRIHHWLELTTPDVLVLTDGSGRCGKPRLNRTLGLITRTGAKPTNFFGRVTDRMLYDSVLDGNVRFFADLTLRIAEVVTEGCYDYVLGDAAEGAIMGHDMFREMLDAAIELVRRDSNRQIANFDFLLEGMPEAAHSRPDLQCHYLHLDQPALKRKIDAALAYTELAHEVVPALKRFGQQAFAVERLRAAITETNQPVFSGKPEYEIYAERVVAVNGYSQVVRYADHVHPLIISLRTLLGLNPLRPSNIGGSQMHLRQATSPAA